MEVIRNMKRLGYKDLVSEEILAQTRLNITDANVVLYLLCNVTLDLPNGT